jgi:hypothetical protein
MTEPVLKFYLTFWIEKFKKNPQIKWDQSHITKNHIKWFISLYKHCLWLNNNVISIVLLKRQSLKWLIISIAF